jgi:hypothetical protein
MPSGTREQEPKWWIEALSVSVMEAIKGAAAGVRAGDPVAAYARVQEPMDYPPILWSVVNGASRSLLLSGHE